MATQSHCENYYVLLYYIHTSFQQYAKLDRCGTSLQRKHGFLFTCEGRRRERNFETSVESIKSLFRNFDMSSSQKLVLERGTRHLNFKKGLGVQLLLYQQGRNCSFPFQLISELKIVLLELNGHWKWNILWCDSDIVHNTKHVSASLFELLHEAISIYFTLVSI